MVAFGSMNKAKMDDKGPLKVLMTSMFGTGHLNACIGIGSLLRKRGHEVYFAHFDENKEKLEKCEFHYISLCEYNDKNYPMLTGIPPDLMKLMADRFEMTTRLSPYGLLKELIDTGYGPNDGMVYVLENCKGENCAMLNIIEKIKPDVCLADHLWTMPWMEKASCPAIPIWSASPINLYNGPPMSSGLSVNDAPELWDEFRRLKDDYEKDIMEKAKELFEHFDVEFKSQNYAKQLGIYIYPGPLDYHELGLPKENWVRLDCSIRKPETADFEIPDKLKDKPGKLIYVSMGTVVSVVPDLVQKIITPLAHSPNRFIVSTGIRGDSVKLYDNMWGDKFVNQVALLPKVDLFITHGGNNSVVEGLAAGKPLIVIPSFGDQPDNAQRIADLGLGVRINLHEFNEQRLLKAIEDVLIDEKIHSNVSRISEELKSSDSSDKVISLIEQLARNKTLEA